MQKQFESIYLVKYFHYTIRNEWRTFLADKRFFLIFWWTTLLTENHKFLEFRKISVLTFGYPGFQKKKWFCDKPVFKTRVKVNVHQVGPPTQIFVTTNFRGNHTLTHVLEIRKAGKWWNFYSECMNKWPTQVCQTFENNSTGGVLTWRRKSDP